MTNEIATPIHSIRPIAFITQFIVLAVGAILPFLVDLGYRVFDVEVFILSLVTALIALAIAFAGMQCALIRRVSFAILAYWFFDLYFIESQVIAWLALVGVIGGTLFFARFENDIRNVVALAAGLFAVMSVLLPSEPALVPPLLTDSSEVGHVNPELPLVVHFILDEQGSPLTASAALRASGRADRLIGAYVERGFAAHTWVRAPAGATQRSLGRIFGLPGAAGENWEKVDGDFTYRLKRNHYVETLLERGFDVTVVQNSFIQLCQDQRAHCHTYPRAIYGHSMARFFDAVADRLLLAVALLHAEQYTQKNVHHVALYRPIGDWLIERGKMPHKRQFWTRPATVLDVLDQIERRAESMRAGEAYLVHLLAPHFPYVLDANCTLRPMRNWEAPGWASDVKETKSKLAVVEEAYWLQVECLHSRLLTIIDTIDRAVGRDNVSIVLHGDHGSRLMRKHSNPTSAQLAVGHLEGSLDTMLLVRAPGIEPALNAERVPLDELRRLTLSRIPLLESR